MPDATNSATQPPLAVRELSDETLMERYRDGDAAAFDVLYARHRGGLYRYLLRQCGNAGIAEELFQDAWMNLIRSRERYTVQARFTTFLYRVAHNRLIDYYRAQKGGIPLSFDDETAPQADEVAELAAPDSDPAVQVERRQTVQRLLEVLAELPEAQREAFVLQQETDMRIEDIAAATGVNRETAKSRLRYALAKLRASLGEAP